MMALHRRATQEGIGTTSVETAMDSATPKAALVDLLLDHKGAAACGCWATQACSNGRQTRGLLRPC